MSVIIVAVNNVAAQRTRLSTETAPGGGAVRAEVSHPLKSQ